jgi:chromosome segregation ATPase
LLRVRGASRLWLAAARTAHPAMAVALRAHYRSAMDPEVRDYLDNMAGMIAREFARINHTLQAITGRFAQVDGRFEQIDARFEQIDARFEQIDARFEEIETRLEGHDRRLDRLDAQFHDLRREMKSEFAVVREAIRVLTARVEARDQGF